MRIERLNLFKDDPKYIRSKFTLDGGYSHKPKYSIAGRMFTEYGTKGTDSARSVKIGYNKNGSSDAYRNDYKYDISRDTSSHIILKDIMDSSNHHDFSSHMYRLLSHMLKSSNMMTYSEQMTYQKDKDSTIEITFNNMSIKDSQGNVLVTGQNVWDNMLANVDNISVQHDGSQHTLHMVYDAKIHILDRLCSKYGLSTYIEASDLTYANLKAKNICDKTFRCRLRVPVISSLGLYDLHEQYQEITSVNDAMYGCSQDDIMYEDRLYKDVTLTDLICGIEGMDVNVTHVYNTQVDAINKQTDITALGHKARQIFLLECVSTGRSVEAVNILVDKTAALYSRMYMEERYKKTVAVAGNDLVISDMFGIADWTVKDALHEELIATNIKDKDIKWINTFVKWYHIINTCSVLISVANLAKGLFFGQKNGHEQSESAVDSSTNRYTATDMSSGR